MTDLGRYAKMQLMTKIFSKENFLVKGRNSKFSKISINTFYITIWRMVYMTKISFSVIQIKFPNLTLHTEQFPLEK